MSEDVGLKVAVSKLAEAIEKLYKAPAPLRPLEEMILEIIKDNRQDINKFLELGATPELLDKMNENLENIAASIDDVDSSIQENGRTLENIETRLSGIEENVDNIDTRLMDIEDHLKNK
jgi:methyl-accepting chemotaxis protein